MEEPQELRPTEEFLHAAEEWGIAFETGDLETLQRFLDLLLETNRQFNLTAISDPATAWMKHIFDSLTLLPYVLDAEAQRVCDVGAGGGLPGLPLAIVLPDVQFTLVEATGKKARFLESAAAALGLKNVRVLHERAETVGRDEEHHRECYDLVTARAVGGMAVLLELTTPLLRPGGRLVAVKGERADTEIGEAKRALHALHCAVVETRRSPTGTIVIVQKLRKTPRLYPRRPGEPKRAPL